MVPGRARWKIRENWAHPWERPLGRDSRRTRLSLSPQGGRGARAAKPRTGKSGHAAIAPAWTRDPVERDKEARAKHSETAQTASPPIFSVLVEDRFAFF
jgi:hypothetical protein